MAQARKVCAGAQEEGFDAIITREEAQKIEDDQVKVWTPRRRVALGTLQKTVDELATLGPLTLAEMVEMIDEWRHNLRTQVSLSESVMARLLLAAGKREADHAR